jgi:hypothetical protein
MLDDMKKKNIINGIEYFNTKLAISHNLLNKGININISESIMDAIKSHKILGGITYYRDPMNEGKLFRIFPNDREYDLIGQIFEREYYEEVY